MKGGLLTGSAVGPPLLISLHPLRAHSLSPTAALSPRLALVKEKALIWSPRTPGPWAAVYKLRLFPAQKFLGSKLLLPRPRSCGKKMLGAPCWSFQGIEEVGRGELVDLGVRGLCCPKKRAKTPTYPAPAQRSSPSHGS